MTMEGHGEREREFDEKVNWGLGLEMCQNSSLQIYIGQHKWCLI
jgi:hypothetical protein